MEHCPKCKSAKLRRSRTRHGLERMRRTLTGKAPFRCPDCGWRGWGFDFGGTAEHPSGRSFDPVEPDLKALDADLDRAGGAGPEE